MPVKIYSRGSNEWAEGHIVGLHENPRDSKRPSAPDSLVVVTYKTSDGAVKIKSVSQTELLAWQDEGPETGK